jgi:hypothetical protein
MVNLTSIPIPPSGVTIFHPLKERGFREIILGDSCNNYKALPQTNHISWSPYIYTKNVMVSWEVLTRQRKLASGLHNIRQCQPFPCVNSTDNTETIYFSTYIRHWSLSFRSKTSDYPCLLSNGVEPAFPEAVKLPSCPLPPSSYFSTLR